MNIEDDENKEKKETCLSYIKKINMSEIINDEAIGKRAEYLWNLALSAVYINVKLSMKYITLIKKITKNNLLFDNICCHYCNLIYIPFYNCKITHSPNQGKATYTCLLCKRKKKNKFTTFKQT